MGILVLLLFTINPEFSALYLSLQKVSIKICFIPPIITLSSAWTQIRFNNIVIFSWTSKLVSKSVVIAVQIFRDRERVRMYHCFLA